jgi:hypothetical protein
MKPHCTLQNLLVHPKDKRDTLSTTNVVYDIPCKNCNLLYIGETGRKFGTRLEEHKGEAEKAGEKVLTRAARKSSQSVINKSAITDHVVDNNHIIDWKEAKIIDREADRSKRWIKEAIAIRKRGTTTMNRDEGQYNLTHVYDDLLTTGKPTGNSATKLSTSSSEVHRRSSLHHQC